MKSLPPRSRTWLFIALIACFSAAPGCSIGTGNMLTFFPERQTLDPDADMARKVTAAQGVLPVARELNKSVTPLYVVEPGDILLVQPAEFDTPVIFPPDQPILPDGTIHLGKYGQVIVAGKTIPEIEARIRMLVAAQHQKDMGAMTVRIVVPDSKVFYVLGEVNTPGAFRLKGRETVLDGILLAGGLNPRASREKIILSRPTPPHGCRIIMPICYDKLVQLGDTTTNYQLRPGDRIFVASRGFFEGMFHNRDSLCHGPQQPCLAGAEECDGCSPCWQTSSPFPMTAPANIGEPQGQVLPPPQHIP